MEFDTLETMAANMNKHKTFSGVISFEEMNFFKSTNENNSANNSTFSEDEEKEANIQMAFRAVSQNNVNNMHAHVGWQKNPEKDRARQIT